jgi:hypothetical protein
MLHRRGHRAVRDVAAYDHRDDQGGELTKAWSLSK